MMEMYGIDAGECMLKWFKGGKYSNQPMKETIQNGKLEETTEQGILIHIGKWLLTL